MGTAVKTKAKQNLTRKIPGT